MCIPPCHVLFQFYVGKNNQLSCHMYQRSCDVFLGLPFNIASYALLTHMFAQQCDLDVGDLIWSGGDIHIYLNHLKQVKIQLRRKPRRLPKLVIKRKPKSLFQYVLDDFDFIGYNPYPSIKAIVSV